MQTAPKALSDIRSEFAALSTVAEDQFETTLASALADLDAAIAAAPTTAPAVTITSVTINLSDSTTKEFDPKA